jgi:hypothetical protein
MLQPLLDDVASFSHSWTSPRQPKLDGHARSCGSWAFTCIDCGVTFSFQDAKVLPNVFARITSADNSNTWVRRPTASVSRSTRSMHWVPRSRVAML